MAKEAFDAIRTGLEEAIAYAQGRTAGARTRAVPVERLDVAAIRRKTGLSQAAFARAFGISRPTLAKWEQGRRSPTGAARLLLRLIDRDPGSVLAALEPEVQDAA